MESVEDAVRAAVEQHTQEESPVETPVIEQEAPVVEERPGRTANRLRDEHGRLLPGKKEEQNAQEESKTEGSQEPVEIPQEPVAIPNSLKATYKAEWGTLPRKWQEEISRLDQAAVKGVEHLKAAARFGDEVTQAVKPYEHMILAEGGTPAAAISDLLATAALFRRGTPEQKQQALMNIAKQFHVPMPKTDISALLQPGAEPQKEQHINFDPMSNPQFRAMMERTQSLEGFVKQHFEAQERQQFEGNLNAVETFLSQRDAQGNALHPLDETLENAFAQEIAAVKAANPTLSANEILAKAYDDLSWKTPEIRKVRLSRLEAEKEAKRKAETQKALDAKRNASGSLTGAPTNSAANPVGGNIRDTVAALYYGNSGRI